MFSDSSSIIPVMVGIMVFAIVLWGYHVKDNKDHLKTKSKSN